MNNIDIGVLMEKISGKVFRKDNTYFVLPISLENYYDQIKKYKTDGYNQVILTADVLIKILKQEFVNHSAKILRIELMDNQDDYQNEVNDLITAVSEDRGKSVILFDELANLDHSDSIELRNVKLSVRNFDDALIIAISNNGYINGEGSPRFIKQLSTIVADVLGRK